LGVEAGSPRKTGGTGVSLKQMRSTGDMVENKTNVGGKEEGGR